MEAHLIIKALLGMFLLTGLFACLNAWGGKWGPAFAMLVLSLASFASGLALGGSVLAVVPALLMIGVVAAIRCNMRPGAQPDSDDTRDLQALSASMLAKMDSNIAARKAGRG